VWLHAGTLLDGVSRTPARDAHVVYDAGGIRFVGVDGRTPPADLTRTGQTAPDIDAPDSTLLPGLVDAHAHLFLEGGEIDLDARTVSLTQSRDVLLARARARLAPLVRLGVAGVRDAGDRHGVGLALARLSVSADRPLMPYLDSPGAAIHHRGRYGAFMAAPIEDFESPRACAESRLRDGADRLKLIATGIIDFKAGRVTTPPQMRAPEIAEIVAVAAAAGRQTFAHASGDVGIDEAIDGGVDSIEHGFFIRDDQLLRLRDRRIAWAPTFAPVQAQVVHADAMGWTPSVVDTLRRILEQHAASLVRAHTRGVIVLAGSDAGSCGVAHGLGLLDEMELMERAGLPSIDVINAATGASADRLAFRDAIGRIAPGYRSRFILTRHSPLETVANLRRPRLITFDGETFDAGEAVAQAGL
jgi:imidazolonepropionase-like amidohydrolase